MMRIAINPVGGPWFVLLIALGMFLMLWRVVPTTPLSAGRRAALVTLRGLVLAALLWGLLRPTIVFSTANRRMPTLVFLVDKSRSMSIADELGGKSRWEAVRRTWDSLAPLWPEMREHFTVRPYTFADTLSPFPDSENGSAPLEGEPDGGQTALGWALESVVRQDFGKGIAAIVVLGDGAQRAYPPRDIPPQTVARQLNQLRVPILAVPFGQPRGRTQTRDVAVTDLLASPTVFVKNTLKVEATVTTDGFVNQEIGVELLLEGANGTMEPVAATTLRPRRDVDRIPVQLSVSPPLAGEFKIALRVAEQPGELVATNNELATVITVLPGGLKVLYAEGTLRRERAFLVRALEASPEMQLDARWIDVRTRDAWPLNMADIVAPGAFEVYLLGDLDAKAWRAEDLKELSKRVSEGSGLMMIGGKQSFGPGGYAETPLRDVLPVEMDRRERQRMEDPPGAGLHIPGPVTMRPTDEGQRTSLMRLAAGTADGDLWDSLPPLDGANRFRGFKRAATVLARSEQGEPLLVAGQFGLGRTLAFAGDSTWRWVMQAGQGDAHKRFWRQVVLWLARQDDRTQGSVWVQLPRRRYAPLAAVEVMAGAESAQRDPILDAQFFAEVTLPDGSRRPLPMAPQAKNFGGSFLDTERPGDYTVEVRAEREGSVLGTARARFLVFDRDLELENPAADGTLMANLAELTAEAGGALVLPEKLPGAIRELFALPSQYDIQVQRRLNLWDNWTYFLVMLGLAATEWALRKRWGLV